MTTMMDKLFDETMLRPFFPEAKEMPVDVVDSGEAFDMYVDLPGFTRDEIRVTFENNVLTIKAEHKDEASDEKKYAIRERRRVSMTRSFIVRDIREDAITATNENGVLHLTLPKNVKPAPRSIEIL